MPGNAVESASGRNRVIRSRKEKFVKRDEMEIIRAISVKLDADTVFFLTYQYHTEKSESILSGRKNDRSKSRYRMVGRVMKVRDVEELARALHRDENRLKPWKWPDDPSWGGSVLYMLDASNEGFSRWLRLKLRKAIGREEAARLMKGYRKDTNRKSRTFGKYVVFTPNAVYDTKGYTCTDGTTVDVDDFDALLSKVGQTVCKEIKMKLVGPGHEIRSNPGSPAAGDEAKPGAWTESAVKATGEAGAGNENIRQASGDDEIPTSAA